ncbi:hypothetical protein A3I46_02805 [Candidatus Kaiserbacteria bacterium RIFCSPLOWO2_02_FULL_54_13]|nr:MAG: hypothetical protein A3I46_02805 [Candidatus Kaiserbacteria bacterium RIFCSPLOWO2_02_FULL_54_13]
MILWARSNCNWCCCEVNRREIEGEVEDLGVDDREDEHGGEDEHEAEDGVVNALFAVALLAHAVLGGDFKPAPDNHNDGEHRGHADGESVKVIEKFCEPRRVRRNSRSKSGNLRERDEPLGKYSQRSGKD